MTDTLLMSHNGTAMCVATWQPADDYVDGEPEGYVVRVTFLYHDGDVESVFVYTAKAHRNDSSPKWGASIIYPWMEGLPDVGFYHDRFESYGDTRAKAVIGAALLAPTELPYDARGLDYSGDGEGYGDDYRPIGGQIGGM